MQSAHVSLVGSIFKGRVEELRVRVFLWPVLLCFFHWMSSDWARAGNVKYIYFTLVRNSCALFRSGYSHTGVVYLYEGFIKKSFYASLSPKDELAVWRARVRVSVLWVGLLSHSHPATELDRESCCAEVARTLLRCRSLAVGTDVLALPRAACPTSKCPSWPPCTMVCSWQVCVPVVPSRNHPKPRGILSIFVVCVLYMSHRWHVTLSAARREGP